MIKLLVVDDEEGICEFISDFFKRRGHIVFTVTNPEDALSILEKEKPQIVLLDIVMPQMSGLELLEKIRKKDKKVKVIMVTVADDAATQEKAFRLGADAFVKKPFTADYLEQIIMEKIQELIRSK